MRCSVNCLRNTIHAAAIVHAGPMALVKNAC